MRIRIRKSGSLDDVKVPIECPGCKRKMQYPLNRMRPGTETKCRGCGATIQFTGDDGAAFERELDRTIERINGIWNR